MGKPANPQDIQEAWETLQKHGGKERFGAAQRASEELGIHRNTFDHRIKLYLQDPAITKAQEVTHSGMTPSGMWIKAPKDEDGIARSVYYKVQEPETPPEDVLEKIASRLNQVQPAPAIRRPKKCSEDLMNFLPLFDVHLSMRVGDYGTADAVERLTSGSEDILGRLPAASHTVIVNGGDFTHQNDPSNLTPQSKHPLPVDMEYDDTTDIATDVTVEIIEKALRVSEHVTYQPLKGNHDPNTARILRAALKQRYRKNSRVTILTDNIDFFAHEWRGNLLCAHHGNVKANQAKDLVLNYAARYHQMWGRNPYRELFIGHLHSVLAVDVPGMLVNRIRAICPMDRHSIEDLWTSYSEMSGVCYKAGGGRYDAVTHYFG